MKKAQAIIIALLFIVGFVAMIFATNDRPREIQYNKTNLLTQLP